VGCLCKQRGALWEGGDGRWWCDVRLYEGHGGMGADASRIGPWRLLLLSSFLISRVLGAGLALMLQGVGRRFFLKRSRLSRRVPGREI
jgi:hypothetical protein